MNGPLENVTRTAERIVLGKSPALRLALACLLARGHLLIEDLPGVGKTTLAHLLGRLLGLHYSRIQFTSDMLPADIVGAAIYDRESQTFKYHPGPVFSQLVLADEGEEWDLEEALSCELGEAHMDDRGRGLAITNAISDRIERYRVDDENLTYCTIIDQEDT